MNHAEAENIIEIGVIPGEIDSIDLKNAEYFMEGYLQGQKSVMEIIEGKNKY